MSSARKLHLSFLQWGFLLLLLLSACCHIAEGTSGDETFTLTSKNPVRVSASPLLSTSHETTDVLPLASKKNRILFLMPPTYTHTIGAYHIAQYYKDTHPEAEIDFFWHSKYIPKHENRMNMLTYQKEAEMSQAMKRAASIANWEGISTSLIQKISHVVSLIYKLTVDDSIEQIQKKKYDLIVTHMVHAAAMDVAEKAKIPLIVLYTPAVLGVGAIGGELYMPSVMNPVSSKQAIHFWDRLKILTSMANMAPEFWKMSKRMDALREEKGFQKRGLSFGLDKNMVLAFTTWGLEYPRDLPPLVQLIGTPFANAVKEAPASASADDMNIAKLNSLREDEYAVLISFGSIVQIDEKMASNLVQGLLSADEKLHVILVDRSEKLNAEEIVKMAPEGQGSGSSLSPLSTVQHDHIRRLTVDHWINQRAVLAHRKVRFIVSHCGSKGFIESVLNEKPILAVPFLGDQPLTANRAEERGFAIVLDKESITRDKVSRATKEMLAREAQFKNNIQRMRKILELEDGRVNAAHWMDVALQMEGFKHMAAPVHIPFYVKHHWDILLFAVVPFCVACGVVLTIVLNLCYRKRLCSQNLKRKINNEKEE